MKTVAIDSQSLLSIAAYSCAADVDCGSDWGDPGKRERVESVCMELTFNSYF